MKCNVTECLFTVKTYNTIQYTQKFRNILWTNFCTLVVNVSEERKEYHFTYYCIIFMLHRTVQSGTGKSLETAK
jgi:hypothetical protein